jgi:hypothetical protein
MKQTCVHHLASNPEVGQPKQGLAANFLADY